MTPNKYTIMFKANPCLLAILFATAQSLSAQNNYPPIGPVYFGDSLTLGANHAAEGFSYEALSLFGGMAVRGDSIHVGKLTVGGWEQIAPFSGLSVAGDTSINGSLGIGVKSPQVKLDVDGAGRFAGVLSSSELHTSAIFGGWQELFSSSPYVDFHLPSDTNPDFNVRMINDQDSQLSFFGTSGAVKLNVFGLVLSADGGSSTISHPRRHHIRSGERIYLLPEGDAVVVGNGKSLLVEGGISVTDSIQYPGNGRLGSGGELKLQSAPGFPLSLNSTVAGDVVVGAPGGSDHILRVHGRVVATTVQLVSDVTKKSGFKPVAHSEILNKVAGMPISSWQYNDAPGVTHVGPTAQDFQRTFGLGEDDTHISVVDGIGVSLAAIKGLHAEVEAKNREIEALKDKVELLQSQVSGLSELSQRLAALEANQAKK